MTDLSKLGIGLTVAFVFSFVALVTELCYIFFRQRKRADDVDEESDISSSSNSWSSKEIFYFFCCKNKSRIEHTGAPTTVHPVDDDNVVEVEQQDELMKWQELHGPSRILYTIKEEEKEDLESEKSCSERKTKKRVGGRGSTSIEEEKEISMVVISMESETETPYLTPCASPPYCTPMSSPPHEIRRNDRTLMYYSESENCFVLEVEKSQRRLSSEKCFPVVICKKE